ncbi:MAG TPA: hypothetical protein VKF40_18990 [Burkholderiales bacterium]|nr:hypothetical protein [Burkholderiales bacterium]
MARWGWFKPFTFVDAVLDRKSLNSSCSFAVPQTARDREARLACATIAGPKRPSEMSVPDPALKCSILAVSTRGELMLRRSLAGLDAQWTTALGANGALYDLYVLDSVAGTRDIVNLYDRIRERERNVAIILVCTNRNVALFHQHITGDPAAYVAVCDTATQLRQLIEHVIESIWSKALAARIDETRTVVEALSDRGARLDERSRQWQRRLTSKQWLKLRAESMHFFQQRGGTASQFERLWPGVCHEALAKAQ